MLSTIPAQPRLWELNDPRLYRVSVRVQHSASVTEVAVWCGFAAHDRECFRVRIVGIGCEPVVITPRILF